jgi:uncharacterized LabA/DUF88 family protein
MRTNIYIDGFNLYYGSLKNTSYKWLDLNLFCKNILPKNNIHKIKYFSAKVVSRNGNPDKPLRQQIYWRALKTLPNLSIIEGSFITKPVRLPLLSTLYSKHPKIVEVMRTEEKGSDVNLAVHLLNDAYKNDFDIAVVISNDSDLLESIKLVKTELKKAVGLINPCPTPSWALQPHVSFFKKVRPWVLKNSQFPDQISDDIGNIQKPQSW